MTRLKKCPDFSLQYPIKKYNKFNEKQSRKNHHLLKELKLKAHRLSEEHLEQCSEEAELLNNKINAQYFSNDYSH